MWPGKGGSSGRTCRCHEAPQGGSSSAGQPVPETFAELHEKDTNTTWREIYHAETNAMYYYNTITNQSQWEHPGVAVKKQPPPPSSPPPSTVLKKKDINIPEHKQWVHVTNDAARGNFWYNTVTGDDQRDRPPCCMKYKK